MKTSREITTKMSTIIKLKISRAEQRKLLETNVTPFPEEKEVVAKQTPITAKRCCWCTLDIVGKIIKVPYDKLGDGNYLGKNQFNHDRCMAAFVEKFLFREKDKIQKYMKEIYGRHIVPAPDKEVMTIYSDSKNAITPEQYLELLDNEDIICKVIHPPLITPISGEVFTFKIK